MITTVAAILACWTAATIPAGVLLGRRLRHHQEEPMPDQSVPRPAGLDALLDHVEAHLSDTFTVLAEVAHERTQQDAKWGEQNHPDGTGGPDSERIAEDARDMCKVMALRGETTWNLVLAEEFYEAVAESDPAKLRGELIQVAAVAAAWVEAIDRRTAARPEAAR